jgi:tetratricopeptide (TPR) repeat protein
MAPERAGAAYAGALAVLAACVALAVTYRIFDTDLWQLLVVGKAMWARHALPMTDEWTWRMWGTPEAVSSWLYRALLWPVWSAGGVEGLFALRGAIALATFGFVVATARRMGARGFAALVVIVAWALLYRARADVRPESLAGLLLAATLWILETRRSGGPDRSLALVPIAVVWANVHHTFLIGLALQAIYAVAGGDARGVRTAAWRAPWAVALGCAAASFLQPYGPRALVAPIEFALRWRGDPTFAAIAELQPLSREFLVRHPFLFLPWAVLILWRARVRRLDRVEVVVFAVSALLAIRWLRFLGIYALLAAPFVARDVHELFARRRAPAWARAEWTRAALATLAMVALTAFTIRSESGLRFGVGLVPTAVPEKACDFIAAHGVRGRGFDDFHLGGYQAYRFWPERERLPFMTTQPELADAEDRRLYGLSMTEEAAWRELDARHRFDYALLDRARTASGRRHDFFDADSTWALVFADDAALVYVRRGGALAAVADSFAFDVMPGGRTARERLVNACFDDSALRARARADVERQIAASPFAAQALVLRGVLDGMDGRDDAARASFERALAIDPAVAQAHWYLGRMELAAGNPAAALAHLKRVEALGARPAGLEREIEAARAGARRR